MEVVGKTHARTASLSEKFSSTSWIGSWVGPRAGRDVSKNRKKSLFRGWVGTTDRPDPTLVTVTAPH